MFSAGPKFWLLGGNMPWPTQRASALGISPSNGIRLAEDSLGPLSLASPDDTLGRLTLPRHMAFDAARTLYLADKRKQLIRRYRDSSGTFDALPSLGSTGVGERHFGSIEAIAIHGKRLYIAHSVVGKVQAYHLQTLALVEQWTSHDVAGDWLPADLAFSGNKLYILDRRHNRILAPQAPYRNLKTVAQGLPRERWQRLAVDQSGGLYVHVIEGGVSRLDYFGHPVSEKPERISSAESVRVRFETPPPIAFDEEGRFLLPASLASACPGSKAPPASEATHRVETQFLRYELDRGRRELRVLLPNGALRSLFGPRNRDGEPVAATNAAAWDPRDLRAEGEAAYILDSANNIVWRHCLGSDSIEVTTREPWQPPAFEPSAPETTIRWFDSAGMAIPAPPQDILVAPRLYQSSGYWLSYPIKSGIHRCEWDRIVLTLLPPSAGASFEVFTFADDDPTLTLSEDDPRWDFAGRYVAPLEATGAPPASVEVDFPVRSRGGENILLMLRLHGDGYETPAIQALRLYFPRQSYLQFLPKIYSSQDEMRRFLEGFLAAFQVTNDGIESTIRNMAAYFDPDSVPAGDAMRFLAGWLALTLEGTWTDEQNRKLLSAAPAFLPYRGTSEGFREFVRVYLANAAGLTVEQVKATEFPLVLEGFLERKAFLLGAAAGPLWSPGAVGRLQLGEFSRLGEVSLISHGDPDLDLFTQQAHRFKIFVPAVWLRDEDTERLIRRAIESAKPAHTAYELVRVENRMRVGIQSTVGLDTIVGEPAQWHLPGSPAEPMLNLGTVLSVSPDSLDLGAGEFLLS